MTHTLQCNNQATVPLPILKKKKKNINPHSGFNPLFSIKKKINKIKNGPCEFNTDLKKRRRKQLRIDLSEVCDNSDWKGDTETAMYTIKYQIKKPNQFYTLKVRLLLCVSFYREDTSLIYPLAFQISS